MVAAGPRRPADAAADCGWYRSVYAAFVAQVIRDDPMQALLPVSNLAGANRGKTGRAAGAMAPSEYQANIRRCLGGYVG